MKSLLHFSQLVPSIALEVGGRYLLMAGIAWLLAYVIFKRHWLHRKVIARLPTNADMRRELAYSALSVVIYAIVAAFTLWMVKQGWTQIYRRIPKHGWDWFVASIGLTIVLHDTYFYWMHRLLHHPRLFRLFHRVHHQSNNPSPWTSYSFGPLEAFLQALIFPMAVLLIPMHPFAFVIFMLFQLAFNVAGHTGFEFYPRWWLKTWFGKFMNTPTNHVLHHEYYRGNYGLYFNVWDRLMGTNHEKYEERFAEVTNRPKAVAPGKEDTPSPSSAELPSTPA